MITETIKRNEQGDVVEHNVTIPKVFYDEILSDRKEFLQALLTKLIDLDTELNEKCVASWQGLPPDEGKASWLRYLSEERTRLDMLLLVC